MPQGGPALRIDALWDEKVHGGGLSHADEEFPTLGGRVLRDLGVPARGCGANGGADTGG